MSKAVKAKSKVNKAYHNSKMGGEDGVLRR
jgi:hypothetical protein